MKPSPASLIGLLLAGSGISIAASTQKRASTFCGQWDSASAGPYTFFNNLWGMQPGDGSQCSTLGGLTTAGGRNALAWSTAFSWGGVRWQVKSFANVVLSFTARRVSALSAIPARWSWSFTGTSIVANVAYDLFTSSTAGGESESEYEIMIWLAALGGAGPLGSVVARPTINGVRWDLFRGNNSDMVVLSYVAATPQSNFNGDLGDFVRYLVTNQAFPATQYLNSIGGGTEVFTGTNAVLTSTDFSVSVS